MVLLGPLVSGRVSDCGVGHAALPGTLPLPARSLRPFPRAALRQRMGWLRPWVCPQVIIVIYLSVVGALLLYMAFLMLVDPLIRKPDAYTEQLHNEQENEVPTGLRGWACHPALRPLGPGSLPLPCAPVKCPTCHPDASVFLAGDCPVDLQMTRGGPVFLLTSGIGQPQ